MPSLSPPPPSQYATFYYDGNVDKVRVKLTSQGRGREVCAIAAVQKSLVSQESYIFLPSLLLPYDFLHI